MDNSSDSRKGGYDAVEIDLPGGGMRRMSRKEFEALPLSDRISSLLKGNARFYLGDTQVDSKLALAS